MGKRLSGGIWAVFFIPIAVPYQQLKSLLLQLPTLLVTKFRIGSDYLENAIDTFNSVYTLYHILFLPIIFLYLKRIDKLKYIIFPIFTALAKEIRKMIE